MYSKESLIFDILHHKRMKERKNRAFSKFKVSFEVIKSDLKKQLSLITFLIQSSFKTLYSEDCVLVLWVPYSFMVQDRIEFF